MTDLLKEIWFQIKYIFKIVINLINSNIIINFILLIVIFFVLVIFLIYVASWLNGTNKSIEKLFNKSKMSTLIYVLLKIIFFMTFFGVIIMIIKLLFLKNLFSVVFFCALVPLCSNQSDLKVIIDDIYYIFEKFDIFVIRILIVFVLPFILVNVIYLFIFLEKTSNFENIFLVDYYVICIFACIIPMYIVFNYTLKCIFKCLIKYNCKVFNNIDYDAFSSVFFCSILVSILQVISNQNVITSMINITHNDPVYIGSRFYFQEYFLQKVIILINTLIIFYSERKNIIMFIIPKDKKKDNNDVKKMEEK